MPTPSSRGDNNPGGQPQSPQPPVKRRRIGYACDLCRVKKNRCDGERPACGPCKEREQSCVYSPQRARISVTQEYVNNLKARNQFLEQQLESRASQESSGSKAPQLSLPSQSGPLQYPQSFERSPSVSNHVATPRPPSNDGSPGEYFGESSAFDFIAKVGSSNAATVPAASKSTFQGQRSMRSVFHAESLAASSPSTVVFEEILGGGSGSDAFELPHRSVADKLVDSYFKYRHPLNPYLHQGTFRSRYHRLWLSQELGGEETTKENLAWLGLVNLVFAFGSDHVNFQTAVGRLSSNPDRSRFFKRAKTLVFSGILQTCKLELVQALLLMSQYLHGSLELSNCWTVVGLAIRTAQELGLYLDPANFTSDIVEQEVRKRVWWGCFVIDRILSSKVGRPPTIHDTPAIRVGLPLTVDDEYLEEKAGYSQPSNIPSKLEYFNRIVAHCRLVEKVLDTLYTGGSSIEETKSRMKYDLPKLLSLSVQLDGELVAWQDSLPPHLRPGSTALEWHFQRQRNTLLMRFLNTQILIHRQTLLFYITRRITDPFQLDVVRPCIKRCVMAACESITQMRLLRQNKLLSSFWHNSHYVFAALGVLLVYQKISPHCRAEIAVPSSLQIEDTIHQGLDNLQRVGGEMHPLATRYVHSFKQLQSRLRSIGDLRANSPLQRPITRPASTSGWKSSPLPSRREEYSSAGKNGNRAIAEVAAQEDPRSAEYTDDYWMTEFDDEFAILQSVLLDNPEWTGFVNEWEQH